MSGKFKRLFSLVCAISVLLTGFVVNADDSTAESGVNRFNVVIVMDASDSMTKTDGPEFRYDAVEQFAFLLADTGNYLGCVVFDTHNREVNSLEAVNGQADKDSVVDTLRETKPNHGWTNIGEALDTAVDMIEADGNPELPSVIVLVSDGNTAFDDEATWDESLEKKADAIEKAREDGIMIYSVCLNADANNPADVSEMQQISDATGGVCIEVNDSEDLQDVLSTFYALIYRTVPIRGEEKVFSDEGEVQYKDFEIPGLGVEEANFILYGHVDSVEILDRNENVCPIDDSYKTIKDDYAMIKWMKPKPGKCTVIVHGDPGTKIYGNMVYNVNLFMEGKSDLQQMTGSDKIPVNFSLQLGTGKTLATNPDDYSGFSADLIITDAYQKEIESVPMDLNKDGNLGFTVTKQLEKGSYFYGFRVTGFSLDRRSELYGPFTIVHSEEPNPTAIPTPPPNSAPVPVKDEVTYKKYVIPFLDNTMTIPVTGLATDAEDSVLYYQIDSSSFVDGKDYTFDGDKITMTDYSLGKGDYIIKATDTGGLSCKIKIKVTAINVGLIAFITVCSIAFLIIVAALLSLWYWKLRRLKGILTVTDASNNEKTIPGGVGQLRLSRLAGNCAGFDPKKSYIQCTGMGYVFFVSKKKFIAKSREPVKKVKIAGNGNPVSVRLPNSEACVIFKFQATVRKGGRGGGGRSGGRRSSGGRGPGRGPGDRPGRSGGSRPVRSAPARGSGGRGVRR